MAEIILVTGGTRSGKSSFAENLALKISKFPAYIATAQIFDDEMAQRVKIHQARRKFFWKNYDAPFDAEKLFPIVKETAILFDSVSMYLTNWLLNKNIDDENIFNEFEIFIDNLIAAAKNSCATVIFVSDEVGAGIVPENKLARVFRDMCGLANQKIASAASKVFLTVAGLAVDIKKIAFKDFAAPNIPNEIETVLRERQRISVISNDEWIEAIQKCCDKEIEILSRDILATIYFIENQCSDAMFLWLGEVFEELLARTQSKELLAAIKKRATFIKNEEERRNIELDIGFAETRFLN